MKYRSVLFIVLISLMLTACTFQEEQARQTIAEESFPDLVLNSGFYQIAQGDNEMITVEAALIEITKKKNLAQFIDASFTQQDREGKLLFEGNAHQLRIDTASDTISFFDGFIVTVHGGEFTITGETLTYDSRKRLLSSEEGQITTLTDKKGGILSGLGFSGDIDKRLFEFTTLKEGYMAYEE